MTAQVQALYEVEVQETLIVSTDTMCPIDRSPSGLTASLLAWNMRLPESLHYARNRINEVVIAQRSGGLFRCAPSFREAPVPNQILQTTLSIQSLEKICDLYTSTYGKRAVEICPDVWQCKVVELCCDSRLPDVASRQTPQAAQFQLTWLERPDNVARGFRHE